MQSNGWVKTLAGTAREHMGLGAASICIIGALGAVAFGSCGRRSQPEASALPAATFPASPKTEASAPPPPGVNTVQSSPQKPAARIIVYVTGAVKRPGVYTLSGDARLYHAVRAAGGFKPNAVSDALNLADRAQDGDQLCVPSRKPAAKVAAQRQYAPPQAIARYRAESAAPLIRKTVLPAPVLLPPTAGPDDEEPTVTVLPTPPAPGRVLGEPTPVVNPEPASPEIQPTGLATRITPPEITPKPARSATSARSNGKFKNPGDGIVHINRATAAELEQLPRCGPAMSAKILAYRAQIGGRFTDLKQLMDVKGCGEKTFEKWQPFLAL